MTKKQLERKLSEAKTLLRQWLRSKSKYAASAYYPEAGLPLKTLKMVGLKGLYRKDEIRYV